jgi:hypothetical protein
VDNIKVNLTEIHTAWGGIDWIHLVQNRDQWTALENTVMNFWVPQNTGKFLGS